MPRHHFSPLFWIITLTLLLLLSPCQRVSNLLDDESAGAATPAPANQDDRTLEPESTGSETAEIDPAITEDPEVATLPELAFVVQNVRQIPAQGEAVSVESGVSVQLSPESLAPGVEAELSQWDIGPEWRQALERNYTIETPFVSLAATGTNDGVGRAVLNMPAASPDSRLAVVIDNTYFSLLDITPTGGHLETAVRLGPSESGGMEQVGSLAPGGSLQLAVLTPKSTAATDNRRHFGKPATQVAGSCGIDLDRNFGRLTHCRHSADGTVQVNFLWNIGITDSDGDQLADAAAKALARYRELGFTAANITPRSPMEIIVETRTGDPQYRSINGVIYLPVDAAKAAIAGTAHDTLHEMAHWIEDEEYNMAWAYWSGGKTWWLETAAENMVMLHDPAYISKNLATYGAITTDDSRLAFQYTPYQWPGDFYAQAQLVKLNMCEDTASCPLSESTFKTAINEGTYPFDNAGAQSKVSANLDAYAQYLLGAPPASGNSAMPLGEPVASGTIYGEFVQVAQSSKSDFQITYNGSAPQMKKETDNQGETIKVAATLQKDGVYPFILSSGLNSRFPGLPIALTIQPGVPFWYRLGSDAPLFHDGSKEMIFQPIHLTLGLPAVRLVAMGKTGGETFQATIKQIDLQGAWLVEPLEAVGGEIACLEELSAQDVTTHVDPNALIPAFSLVGAMGDFLPDDTGNSLSWDWNMPRVPAEASPYAGSVLFYEAGALPGVDKIQMQSKLEWKQSTADASTQPQWPPLMFGMAMILPGAWAWRKGGKQPLLIMVTLFLGVFLLAGCFGVGVDMYGTLAVDHEFTKLEYLGGDAIPVVGGDEVSAGMPLWKMQGTADYDVDFYFSATVSEEDGEGAETVTITHCTGKKTYKVEAQIFKDLVIKLD